jgi:hypothetical protein
LLGRLELAQLLEAKDNLQRMMAQIPLTDDERAAVEDGTTAVERLIQSVGRRTHPGGPSTNSTSAIRDVMSALGGQFDEAYALFNKRPSLSIGH